MNPNHKHYLFLLVPLLLLHVAPLLAQPEKEIEISKCVRIEAGYIFGNQIFSDDPLSAPGGMFNYSYGVKVSPKIGFGIGSGLNLFTEETFVPIYGNIITFLKEKKNTTYLDFKVGYALVWSNNYANYESYSTRGGMTLGFAIGRRFQINERFCFTLAANYNHQFATASYSTNGTNQITEQLNYDLLSLSLGAMLEQK